MQRLVVDTITNEEDLTRLEPEWLALEEASGNTLPFRTAAWASSWWSHLRQNRRALRDTLSVRAVRTHDGRLVGVAPMMITARPGSGPVAVRCLQFMGTDPNVTELRGPLFMPALEDDCFRALADDATRRRRDWDWAVWSGVPRGSVAATTLERGGAIWTREIPSYVLPLHRTSDWAAFKSALPRNVKESLRKCYNAPKRDGLSLSFEVVRDPALVPAAVEDVFRLHSMRAALEGTVRHADAFADDGVKRFVLDVCKRLAARDVTRVFRLRIGDAVVATRIGFALNGCLYLYYSGFDPEYGKYSVMTTTVAEAIQYAFTEGFTSVNLSTGNDVSKTRWSPEERVHVEGEQVSSEVRGRVAHGAFRWATRALEHPRIGRYARQLAARRGA
jgi:CelD/BcsL family acetyltransferase involved in cellulose biosynthesis